MKIALAQINPEKGAVQENIEKHLIYINKAVNNKADLVVFPELSLTGYEPELADKLAFKLDDIRLEVFQQVSDKNQIVIGVGVPIRQDNGVNIGLVLFQPNKARNLYAKKHLHADEESYFVLGKNIDPLEIKGERVALAICYEISIEAHTQKSLSNSETVFLASVAKTEKGIAEAKSRLAKVAADYQVTTMVVNNVGEADGVLCTGNSAVWNKQGTLITELDNLNERLLIFDTSDK